MERPRDFIRTLTLHYRRLHGRQTRIFQFSSTGRGGKVAVAALPPLSWAVKRHFPVFLRCESRKTRSCRFTAALIGGKVAFPVFLRSDRRKTGNFSFTAALIGGIVGFRNFPRSERMKTGNCRYVGGTYGGNISILFLILFPLLLPVGGSSVGA
ncbi:hypothetical protein AAC387_Pa07g3939 [Persea americana]